MIACTGEELGTISSEPRARATQVSKMRSHSLNRLTATAFYNPSLHYDTLREQLGPSTPSPTPLSSPSGFGFPSLSATGTRSQSLQSSENPSTPQRLSIWKAGLEIISLNVRLKWLFLIHRWVPKSEGLRWGSSLCRGSFVFLIGGVTYLPSRP